MCGCSKGNVRNFEIVLDSKNARQVQNGICLVVTKSMFEIRWGRIMIKIKDNIIKLEQKKRCDQVASLHEHVAYSELVSHRILDKTGLRQQSTFADGTCVEVDFSKGTYKITVNG